jgi:predicted secreted protein
MYTYLGPLQLHLTTPDRGQLDIYPAYYYKVSKQNGWRGTG